MKKAFMAMVLAVVFLTVAAAKITTDRLKIGNKTAEDIYIEFDVGAATNPVIKWDNATGQVQFANDGVNYTALGGGAGGSGGGGGVNVLGAENWDFELGTQKWTSAGTATFDVTEVTGEVGFGGKSGEWDANATGASLTSEIVAVPNGLKGKLCVVEIQYNGGDANIDLSAWDGSADITGSSVTLEASTVWKTASSTFICPDTGNFSMRLTSTASAAAIFIDNVILGTKSTLSIPDSRWPSYDETEVTVTGSPVLSNYEAFFIPYQNTNGDWFLSYNITSTTGTSGTQMDFTITGVVFKNTATGKHWPIYPGSGSSSPANLMTGYATENSNIIELGAAANRITWSVGGDTPLESKPTWATKVGPDVYLSGMPDTDALGGDWVDFTPVNVGGGFSGTFDEARYRRSGPDMIGMVAYSCDGSESGQMSISVPNGETVDETTLQNYSSIGSATLYDLSANINHGNIYWLESLDRIALAAMYSDVTFLYKSGADMDASSVPFECVSGDKISFNFRLPIQGWTTAEYLANAITGFNEATFDGKPGLASKQVDSGVFTPANSGSSDLNVSSVTYRPATWFRIGSRVHVSGALTVTCSASSEIKIYLTVPVSSDITDQYSVGGSGGHVHASGTAEYALVVRGDTVNDGVFLQGECSFNSALGVMGYTYAYTVQ